VTHALPLLLRCTMQTKEALQSGEIRSETRLKRQMSHAWPPQISLFSVLMGSICLQSKEKYVEAASVDCWCCAGSAPM